MEIICFHNPDEDNGYLSNWYLCRFKSSGIYYSSMEQYMMYQKAMTFRDYSTAGDIMNTDDVSEIKRLGRSVRGYNDLVWNGVRQPIVFRGLCDKFWSNTSLAMQLADTGDAILAECAVHDRIWGIGLSMTDPDRFDMSKWKGENLLGFSLMLVRSVHRRDPFMKGESR